MDIYAVVENIYIFLCPTFQSIFDKLTTTNSNVASGLGVNGVRLKDNSGMYHAEGMYNFKKFLPYF